MATIREYQRKITSLTNTRKITGSMKMVSSIKLQRMTKLNAAMQPFIAANRELLHTIHRLGESNSLVISGHERTERTHYLVITGDRGMCGRFNTNTLRAFHAHKSGKGQSRKNVTVSCMGQKGYSFLTRHGENVVRNYPDCTISPSFEVVGEATRDLLGKFTSGDAHEVWIVYAKRASSFSEEPVVERLLPFPATDEAGEIDYLLEEDLKELIDGCAPLLLQGLVYEALVTSAVAEHAARMSAMENASSNSDRMTAHYIQLRNRARQAAITTELNEIVTGKEALQS